MTASEFSKQVPASGFLSRLLGRTTTSYALAIVFGADSVDKVDGELAAAKQALLDWVPKRERKDFIMVTLFGPQPVCDAVEEGMTKLCRRDAEVEPLLRGLPVQLFFNGREEKMI